MDAEIEWMAFHAGVNETVDEPEAISSVWQGVGTSKQLGLLTRYIPQFFILPQQFVSCGDHNTNRGYHDSFFYTFLGHLLPYSVLLPQVFPVPLTLGFMPLFDYTYW